MQEHGPSYHQYYRGEVAEVKEGRAEVTSNKGNTVGKNGTTEDPAVVIERPGVGCHVWPRVAVAKHFSAFLRTMFSSSLPTS